MTPTERFASYTVPHPTKPCLMWVGGDDSNSGYGETSLNGRKTKAHIAAYELATGHAVPDGLELDHECEDGERQCVRVGPGHVVAKTHAANMQAMAERQAAKKAAEEVAEAAVLAILPGLGEAVAAADILAVASAQGLPEAA